MHDPVGRTLLGFQEATTTGLKGINQQELKGTKMKN